MRINNLLTLVVLFLIIAVFLKILIKLLPLALIIIPAYYLLKKSAENREQVYKQCGYCKKKAGRRAVDCDFCGRPLE